MDHRFPLKVVVDPEFTWPLIKRTIGTGHTSTVKRIRDERFLSCEADSGDKHIVGRSALGTTVNEGPFTQKWRRLNSFA